MSYRHIRTKRQSSLIPGVDADALNKVLNEMLQAAGPGGGYLPLESLGMRIAPGERGLLIFCVSFFTHTVCKYIHLLAFSSPLCVGYQLVHG